VSGQDDANMLCGMSAYDVEKKVQTTDMFVSDMLNANMTACMYVGIITKWVRTPPFKKELGEMHNT